MKAIETLRNGLRDTRATARSETEENFVAEMQEALKEIEECIAEQPHGNT